MKNKQKKGTPMGFFSALGRSLLMPIATLAVAGLLMVVNISNGNSFF